MLTATDPDAGAIFAAMTTPPTTARRALISAAVRSLKSAGVWSLLDVLQVYAAADAQAAGINWRQPGTYNATLVNSPTFTADRGVAGDGATSYVSSGFNPSAASSPAYVRDSASFGLWRRTAGAGGGYGGASSGNNLLLLTNSAARVNSLNGVAASLGGALGLLVANRPNSANAVVYVNGAQTATATDASSAIPTAALAAGVWGATNFSSAQFAALFAGASLSAAQQAALYTALQTYMQAVGAA